MKKIMLATLLAVLSGCSTSTLQDNLATSSQAIADVTDFVDEAKQAYEAGDYQSAYSLYKRVISTVPNNPPFLKAGAEVALKLGLYQQAIEWNEKALAILLQLHNEDHPDVAGARYNLGLAWGEKGDYDKAIDYYELALESDLKNYGEDHPELAMYRNNLGSFWQAKGNYDKAIEYYKLALESDLKNYGENHPYTKGTRYNLKKAISDKNKN